MAFSKHSNKKEIVKWKRNVQWTNLDIYLSIFNTQFYYLISFRFAVNVILEVSIKIQSLLKSIGIATCDQLSSCLNRIPKHDKVSYILVKSLFAHKNILKEIDICLPALMKIIISCYRFLIGESRAP